MKVLVFGASNSRQSINKQLATHAANILKTEINTDADIEVLDLNDYELPIYSFDHEQENGIPDPAKELFSKIGAAEALIISYAEHNGSYTAAFKNTFDWMSRIEPKVFQGKIMMALSTSPGKGGASTVLNAAVGSAPYFGAEIKGSLSLPEFYNNFDSTKGELSNADYATQLREQLKTCFALS